MTALAIVPSPDSAARTAETVRLTHLTSLQQVHDDLDKHSFLRGRFILLPNVSEGGTATLMRSGHAAHYADMPCVGGYLDGNISQLGEGNLRILSGQDVAYGSRKLGLYQTSDNRRRDFADLGKSTTWVKWAAPTAEALRQACLARESRLSQSAPQLPQVTITALDVSNSSFLGPIHVDFNPQFNALIGGRGTGKSTILEYIRWGLCDSSIPNDGDAVDIARRERLVEQTLKPFNATVTVHLSLNGVPHVIRRHAGDGAIALKIGMDAFESCNQGDVQSLLPIQAYSQKQLSNVGVRLEELRRFVREPIRSALSDLQRDLDDVASRIRTSYSSLASYRRLKAEEQDDERTLQSLTERASSIRAAISGVSDQDRAILNDKPIQDLEDDAARGIRITGERIRSILTNTRDTIRNLGTVGPLDGDLLSANAAFEEYRMGLDHQLAEQLDTLDRIQLLSAPVGQGLERWRIRYAAFLESYDQAKARATTQQVELDQLTEIDQRVQEIRTRSALRQEQLDVLGKPHDVLKAIREKWYELHEARVRLLAAQCEALTRLSDGQLLATLAPGFIAEAFELRLRQSLTGTNIRREKFNAVADYLTRSSSPIREAGRVLDEIELLIQSNGKSDTALAHDTPVLSDLGFTQVELQRIAGKMTVDAWIGLATTSLEDQPSFEYRLRENEYIPFVNASAGQQATSLLWALLNQDGPPLMIDQPEDDLDNQILLKVVEQIWRAKDRRQLVFSSHNANVVVNGDADLVICCDYRITGEQSGGWIRSEGAIDLEPVRQDIASIMEGGKAAFRLRQEKYGF